MLNAEETTEPPSSGEQDLLCLGYMTCLRHCLGLRGEQVSLVALLGLSGEAFRFFFHRDAPERGPYVLSHNPLRAASGALGYDCQIEAREGREQAAPALEKAVREEPAIIRCEGEWVAVTACKHHRYHVHRPGGEEEWWQADALLECWQREAGFLELGPVGYYFFQLGKKERTPDVRESAVGSLRRGIRLMTRRTKVQGAAAGLAAYEEMANVLSRQLRGPEQAALALRRYAAWKRVSAPYAEASRKAAVQYVELMGKQFGQEPREHMKEAASQFRKAVRLLEEMPDPPAVALEDKRAPAPGRMALWQFSRVRRQAASRARRLQAVEREAVEVMRKAADSQERLLRS